MVVKRRFSAGLLATVVCFLAACAVPNPAPFDRAAAKSRLGIGRHGVVATVHPFATGAGIDAMRRGGNAIDAAVAAALMLGVVDGHNSGLGGGCFILVRRANGQILAIDGREKAPARAHRDMYQRDGQVVAALSKTGALAAGVPGALGAFDHALRHGGQLTLASLLRPAAHRAQEGFTIDALYAQRLKSEAQDLAGFDASAAIFLDPNGKPWPEGHVLVQRDLARTYRQIAQHGIDWFYEGPFAQAVGKWMTSHTGILTAADFARYRIQERDPVVTTYRGYTVVGFGPPSSGGVHVGQILNVLEHFDLAHMQKHDPAQRLHVMAEAMKLAFADRAHWLGDPDFAAVPRGLVSKAYARALVDRIDLDKVKPVLRHSIPPDFDKNHFGKHTTHIAAADAQGNWVAITTTLNTAFGSKVTIPGTGVLLNNQMDDFSAQPGVPNVFGLIGAQANRIAPGKRPLSSMSPTIVLKDDGPVLTLGAAGGPTIISQVVQVIVNHLDLGMDLPEAVATARIHHQWRPDTVVAEPEVSAPLLDTLRALGHTVDQRRFGVCQAIGRTPDNMLIGVHDPRVPGLARGLDD